MIYIKIPVHNIISENYFCPLRIRSLVKYNKYSYLQSIIDNLFNKYFPFFFFYKNIKMITASHNYVHYIINYNKRQLI